VLLQGFFREFFPVCGAFVSTGIGDVPAGFGVHPRRCSRTSSPRAWARSRRSGRALRLILNAPSPSVDGVFWYTNEEPS
jgi:hypothetical protein